MKKSEALIYMLAGYGIYDLSKKLYQSGALQDCVNCVKKKAAERSEKKREETIVDTTAL